MRGVLGSRVQIKNTEPREIEEDSRKGNALLRKRREENVSVVFL